MTDDHYKKLERMYLSANINTALFETTQMEVSKGKAVIHLDISSKYFHALGAINGSVYFKLLDDAAFFAANSIVSDVFVLTKSFEINFKRPVSDGRVKAVGMLQQESGTGIVASSELFNEAGKVVANGSGVFVRSTAALTPKIGYT